VKASIVRRLAALAFATVMVADYLPATAAVPDAEVEGLQMPAWLIRGGKREPLAIGTQLRNGDQINTGTGSRALLRMGDGSTVKLGENARFSLDGMAQKAEGGTSLFTASMAVVEGAFRFTTSLFYKFRGKREVDVHFATVTAGVRGTDLWGKSSSERDVVALIEGKITLSRTGQTAITMQEPKTVFLAPRDAPPPPIQQIADDVLAKFAAETEMEPGKGAAGRGGRWRIYAARTKSQDEALAIYDKLRDAGYPATINPTQADSGTLYQVRITGLLSETDGTTMAIRLKVELGLEHVAVSLQ
jgi:hypothetical protein